MYLNKTSTFALGALLLIGAAGCGSKGAATDQIAVVNGEPITAADFHSYLERKPIVKVIVNDGKGRSAPVDLPVATPLAFQALGDLIQRHLLMQIAKDEHVEPTDADIIKELDFQKTLKPDYVKNLTAQGFSLDDIKKDLALQIARTRILTKGITVTPADVDKYMKDHPKEFQQPEEALLVFVQVSKPDAKKQVDNELASGQNFRAVAARYNEAPGARQNNSTWQQTVVAQMPQKLQDIVHNTPELKSSDWVQDGNNSLKFYVEKKSAAHPLALSEVQKQYVQRQLAERQGLQASDLGKRMQAKLTQAKIDVLKVSLKDQWTKAFENLRAQTAAQDNAATTAGGTGGGTAGTPGVPPAATAGTTGATTGTTPPAGTAGTTGAPTTAGGTTGK